MKSAGLSSKVRKAFKELNKTSMFASQQEGHLMAKEKQRLMRHEAMKAQIARQQKAGAEKNSAAPASTEPKPA